jgi:hypothetical protein
MSGQDVHPVARVLPELDELPGYDELRGRALLRRAMQSCDWPLLAAYVRMMRETGDPVERIYERARERHPAVPRLEELESQPRL